jgi:hypothetical protein
MPQAQKQLQLRHNAIALASCPGWTHFALPVLRKIVADLGDEILEWHGLSDVERNEKRAARKALKDDFLKVLHDLAEGSFHNASDATGIAEPGPDAILAKQYLSAFKPIDAPQTAVVLPWEADPTPFTDMAPIFSPFDGPVKPILRSPPTPPTP